MSTFMAVAFNDETTAFEMRAALLKMQARFLIQLEDAVVVSKNQQGMTTLDQAVSFTAPGAVGGGFWGLLIGLIFLSPVGAALGAGAGALSGWFSHVGLNDRMMKDPAQSLKPG